MVARALQSVYSQFARQDMALLLDTVTSLGSLALIAGFWALGMTIIETYVLTGLGLTLFVAAVLVHSFRRNARERS
jgi:ABC-type phosphate transport system permease subunit